MGSCQCVCRTVSQLKGSRGKAPVHKVSSLHTRYLEKIMLNKSQHWNHAQDTSEYHSYYPHPVTRKYGHCRQNPSVLEVHTSILCLLFLFLSPWCLTTLQGPFIFLLSAVPSSWRMEKDLQLDITVYYWLAEGTVPETQTHWSVLSARCLRMA